MHKCSSVYLFINQITSKLKSKRKETSHLVFVVLRVPFEEPAGLFLLPAHISLAPACRGGYHA